MKIPVVENVLKLNDEVAAMNRRDLRGAGVFSIDLIGAPGCGKTALLSNTCRTLGSDIRIGIIVGDLTTQRDADRMSAYCSQVVQINTGKGCHLDANQVRQAMSHIDLAQVDLLFIENVGNLICPVGFDLGQDVKVGMFSVAEGDDKAAKHPYLVHEASLLILNKMDLMNHVPFNESVFREDVRKLNPQVPLLEMSVMDAYGMDRWFEWLRAKLSMADSRSTVADGLSA